MWTAVWWNTAGARRRREARRKSRPRAAAPPSAAAKSDPFFEELVLGSYGPGWYYFRFRPVSANIERHRCGEWSDWSQGYELVWDFQGSAD